MANNESGIFTTEEHSWAQKELRETIRTQRTSDQSLEQLGQFYYDLIMERRENPSSCNNIDDVQPKEIVIKGERMMSVAQEPATITRINMVRGIGNLGAKVAIVVPIISEVIGLVTGIDTRPLSASFLIGGSTGFGLSRLLTDDDQHRIEEQSV